MSAVLSSKLLDQLGGMGEVPLFMRVLVLAAERADAEGAARFEKGELRQLLRHEGEMIPRSGASVDRAIERATRLGLLRAESRRSCLLLPTDRVRSIRDGSDD